MLDLAVVLTAGGATMAAGFIAVFIQILKGVAFVGKIVDGYEMTFAFLFSLVLVLFAYVSTAPVYDANGAFLAFVAWLGIAKLAMGIHDSIPDSVNAKLAGKTTGG